MKKYFVVILMMLMSCGPASEQGNHRLNEDKLQRYIQVAKRIKAQYPEFGANDEENEQQANAFIKEFEKDISEAGYANSAEFLEDQIRIGMAYSIVRSEKSLSRFDSLKNSGIAQIDSALMAPNVPDSVKAKLEEEKKTITQMYDQNKQVAQNTEAIIGSAFDKEEVELIWKYEAELSDIFNFKKK